MTDDVYYPDISPLKTGLAGKCPRCGRGRLFKGVLIAQQWKTGAREGRIAR